LAVVSFCIVTVRIVIHRNKQKTTPEIVDRCPTR